jgi:hypothetical protein
MERILGKESNSRVALGTSSGTLLDAQCKLEPSEESFNRQKKSQIKVLWLVVSTPLKNISHLGLLFPIYGKTKNVSNIFKPPTR